MVTAQERREVSDFLDAVMVTRPMQYCHNILIAKVKFTVLLVLRASTVGC